MRIFLLLIALLWGPSALAAEGCTFRPGSQIAQATVALPSSLSIPRNASNGTPLWDSGWKRFSDATIECDVRGMVTGIHAGAIGAEVPGLANHNGLPYVFATNVPGIGVSVFWCNQMLCNPNPTQITPLPSLNWPVDAPTRYPLSTNWRVLLIKTDDIDVSAGVVTIGGSSEVRYNNLAVTKLSITSSSQITGLGCEMNADSRSIDVRLPTIAKTDFDAPIPRSNDKAKTFNINLLCDSGVKVSYQVDGTQTSAGSSILANSSDEGMASGVGVMLFEGDLSSTTQLQLGSKLVHGTTSLSSTRVKIPLTARYVRTAASPSAMGSGLVSTTAFFTLFYE